MNAGCSDLLSSMSGAFFRQFMGDSFPSFRNESPVSNSNKERGRKRKSSGASSSDASVGSSCQTPPLRGQDVSSEEPPAKRLRSPHMTVPVPNNTPSTPSSSSNKKTSLSTDPQLQSDFLRIIPEEVVGHCLSFLGSVEDRHALQTTCVQFRRISNTDAMLNNIELGGDHETGERGIIREHDTPVTAAAALTPFARAGNLEAIYMLGIIKSYCHQDVERGIFLLKLASSRGYVRSSYALGLILRDSMREQSCHYLQLAAKKGYLPALQELLPAREMKAKYGEPDAEELRRHLDPICLNRLLGRHYLQSKQLQGVNTSHCWNPLCGRWAFKATVTTNNGVQVRTRRNDRPFSFTFFRHPGERPVDGPQGRQAQAATAHSSSATFNARARSRQDDEEARNNDVVPFDEPPPNRPAVETPEAADPLTGQNIDLRVSRMKMCSRCCRAKYCSKLCQVYDWRSGRHKMECQFL